MLALTVRQLNFSETDHSTSEKREKQSVHSIRTCTRRNASCHVNRTSKRSPGARSAAESKRLRRGHGRAVDVAVAHHGAVPHEQVTLQVFVAFVGAAAVAQEGSLHVVDVAVARQRRLGLEPTAAVDALPVHNATETSSNVHIPKIDMDVQHSTSSRSRSARMLSSLVFRISITKNSIFYV